MDICLPTIQRIGALAIVIGASCIPILVNAQSQALSSPLSNPATIPTSERMANADRDFAEFVKLEPQKEVSVNVFFRGAQTIDAAREMAKRAEARTIEVHGFRHVSGGYKLFPGQSADDALRNYAHDHKLFMQKDIGGCQFNCVTGIHTGTRSANIMTN